MHALRVPSEVALTDEAQQPTEIVAADCVAPRTASPVGGREDLATRVVGPRREKNAADLESDRLYNSPQHEGLGDPLNMNTSAGTLFGVYEWLDHDVGVRWLWPGELGTYVPSLPTMALQNGNSVTVDFG